MAGPIETVEIPLRDGIYANGSLYDIGPRLVAADNAVYGFRYPHVDASYTNTMGPPHLLRLPPMPMAQQITYSTLLMPLGLAFALNTTFGGIFVLGTETTGQFLRAWSAVPGVIVLPAAGVTNSVILNTSDPVPAVAAYWSTPGAGVKITGPALFFTHPSATHIYYLLDNATTFRSMTTDVGVPCPLGATALCVYLDRLWMASRGTAPYVTTNIFYTDPFDAEKVRGTSFVTIDDAVTCMLPLVPGQVDASGIARLVIGGQSSVWVIEGDPSSNQAVRRQVLAGVGIPNSLAACQTTTGVVFLGTDYQLYLLPVGAQQCVPLGTPIQSVVQRTGLGVLGGTTRASVSWFEPYVYYAPVGTKDLYYVCDLTDPAHPTWWGPLWNSANYSALAGFTVASPLMSTAHTPSGQAGPSIHSVAIVSGVSANYTAFDRFTTGKGVQGFEGLRRQVLRTGFLHRPRTRVVVRRVILETTQKSPTAAPAYEWTITLTNERGEALTASRNAQDLAGVPLTLPTNTRHDINRIATHAYVFPAPFPHGTARAVQLTVSGPSAVTALHTNGMDLQRLRVELEYVPEAVA